MLKHVKGNIHTNSIENYWSLLKRGIIPTSALVPPVPLSEPSVQQSEDNDQGLFFRR
jgi:hypothetical protein